MSELNMTRKIFLEREELLRFQEFLIDSTVANLIRNNTVSFGVVRDNFVGNDTNFLPSIGTTAGTIQFAKTESKALDSDFNLMRLAAVDNIAVPQNGNFYWVGISYLERRYEAGMVSIDTSGNITGIGTSFLSVLRGQATSVPVKVRFLRNLSGSLVPALNGDVYDIVDVTSNTSALLSPSTFVAESGLFMLVVGSSPIGELITNDQREGLYIYDHTQIDIDAETVVNTAPTIPANQTNKKFYVARVVNNAGVLTIEDRRTNFWSFNTPGLDGKLTTINTLSEFDTQAEKSSARTNLDVYSKGEVDTIGANLQTNIDQKVGPNDVLVRNNTEVFTPQTDYNPSTKKYVDDEISSALGIVLASGTYTVGDIAVTGQFDLRTIPLGKTLTSTNYIAIMSFRQAGAAPGNENVAPPIVIARNTTSFQVGLVDNGEIQNLLLDWIIIGI